MTKPAVIIVAFGLLIAVLAVVMILHVQRQPAVQQIWSYETGGKVWSVGISSDGSYIVAGTDPSFGGPGGHDNKVYLFSRASSKPLWICKVDSPVSCVAISSDSSYIAVGTEGTLEPTGFGGKVYLFSKSDNSPLWSYECPSAFLENRIWVSSVRWVSISSDGSFITAGNSNHTIYLFSRASGTPIWSYETGDTIWQTAISSDGSYVAAGSYDGKVYLFSRNDNNPLWNYDAGAQLCDINGISMSSDGSYIAAVSVDKTKGWEYSPYNKLYLFSRSSSTPLWSYQLPYGGMSVAISSDGSYIVARSTANSKEEFTAHLFSRSDNIPLWSFKGVLGIAISADGSYVVGGGSNTVYLFSKDNNKSLGSYSTGGEVWSLATSSDGRYVAAGGLDHKVYVFDRERV
jgi:WD40 repeat protein